MKEYNTLIDTVFSFLARHYPNQYSALLKSWVSEKVLISTNLDKKGRCTWNREDNTVTIELSGDLATNEDVRSALSHEIAHALTYLTVGEHTHENIHFEAWCVRLGTYSVDK